MTNDRAVCGTLNKMESELAVPVRYRLPVGDASVALAPIVGHPLSLHHTGEIFCIHCGRKTSKSFNQGYCFPCFRNLAQCDMCIVKPELCHFDRGTCREPEWGLAHCMQPHVVYLANSSGVKVGITRQSQVPTRWIDQGAVQALPILRVASRLVAGLAEVAIKRHVSDRTSWQKMLKNDVDPIDLPATRDALLAACAEEIEGIKARFGPDALARLPEEAPVTIVYPVLHYPDKVKAIDLDKTKHASGTLIGIKGQYLVFDTGVINIRKYGGYRVEVDY